jgi:DNA replication licensing factor MCM4
VTQVLWGTNINTSKLQEKIKEFLEVFKPQIDDDDMDLNDENTRPYYISQMFTIAETQEYYLDIDCMHIHQFDKELYRQLEDYPTDVIPIFDLVAL